MSKPKNFLSDLVRQAGRAAKKQSGRDALKNAEAKIFNILEYAEAPWGLQMKLYPAQRFLIKLYYNIPLDTTLPEDPAKRIVITDFTKRKVIGEFTEAQYLTFLYNEGRCNIKELDHERRELLLSIGRRGGKCLVGDTLVLTDTGIQEIASLGDSEGPEYQPLQIGVAQEGSRLSESAFFYNGGEQDTLRFTTAHGYTEEGTGKHRVKVLDETGKISWRRLDDLRVGDVVAVHRGTDLWTTAYVNVSKYAEDLTGRKDVTLPEHFTEDWGTLLGILVGDGTWGEKGQLEVTVGPYSAWLAQVQSMFHDLLGGTGLQVTGNVSRVRFHSTKARQFLDRLGYNLDATSDTKRVPWVVLRSPKTVVAAFLRGLFETDGGVESGRKVTLSSASVKLLRDVQTLLLNFGILSSVTPKYNSVFDKTYYHLSLLGAESVRKFAAQIGFLSERKDRLLRTHIAKGDLGNRGATESIPFQRAWCRRLLESVPKNNGKSKSGWRRSLLRKALGNTLKASTIEDLTYPRLKVALAVAREVGADPSVIGHFEEIVAAGYFYDEVKDLTPGRERVYDLTVPDGESFVANGFTNHNTTLSGVFASYEVYRLLNLYNPQEYYGIPNGNRIQVISVATNKEQASLLFNEVTTHINKCEYFKPFLASNTQSRVEFRTPYDIEKFGGVDKIHDASGRYTNLNGKATVRVTFSPCIAKGLRGAGNLVAILDEVAHFQNKGGASAQDVYDALGPSLAAFSLKDDAGKPLKDEEGDELPAESRMIMISSPLGKEGLFYKRYQLAMQGGKAAKNLLAIQAPTWEINPSVTSDVFITKFHENPEGFRVEFGAEFSDQIRGWLERKEDLLECIDLNRRPIMSARPRMPHQMGIDLGLVGDSTAVAITHCEGDRVVLDYHEVWTAGKDWREDNPHLIVDGSPMYPTEYARSLSSVVRLDFDEISAWIESLCKRFYVTSGLFDRWNGIPLEQALHKKGLKQFKSVFFTTAETSKMYQTAKMYIYDERLRLYDWPATTIAGEKHSLLIQELLALQATQTGKNLIKVQAPKTDDAHDDLSDALIRSVWLSVERASGGNSFESDFRGGASSAPMTMERFLALKNRRSGGMASARPTGRVLRQRIASQGRR